MVEYLEYDFQADALILGERVKGGIFRPSCKTLRWSTITMTLRKFFNSQEIHAVGIIDKYSSDYFIYSPTERVSKISRLPLQVEILNNVKGRVYILKTPDINFPSEIEISLGALISKGFGKSKLKFNREVIPNVRKGILSTRIPIKYKDKFLIKNIIKPVYGYLYEPINEKEGFYIKSLFEGSEVSAPDFLLKEVKNER